MKFLLLQHHILAQNLQNHQAQYHSVFLNFLSPTLTLVIYWHQQNHLTKYVCQTIHTQSNAEKYSYIYIYAHVRIITTKNISHYLHIWVQP